MKKLIAVVTITIILGFFGFAQVKAQNAETGGEKTHMSQMMKNQEQMMEMMKNMQVNMDKMMSNCMGMMQKMHGSEGGKMMEHHEGMMEKQ